MGGWLSQKNLRSEYKNLGQIVASKNLGGNALLQANFGQDLDCTITSVAFVLGGEARYNAVEEVAKKHGYNGETYGTIPFALKRIMSECLARFGLVGTAHSAYGKGFGWNFRKVKRLIDSGHYVILNIWRDGRRYYDNHTVTVIGYEVYKHNKFLIVYDNWHKTQGYVDYDNLCGIASINWYE